MSFQNNKLEFFLAIKFFIIFIIISSPSFAQSKKEKWIGTAPFCLASKSDCTDIGWNYVKSSETGDGSKCATGEKVLCQSYTIKPGQKWIGTAPFCDAKSADCKSELGMKYVLSASCGDGACCATGKKVLCEPVNTTPGQKWIGTAPACDAHSNDCKTELGMKYVLSATCGDGACCATGKKVLCEPVNPTPGQKWIGTAPACDAHSSDCKTDLGMKYVLSATCGDGACCTTGKKVLCEPVNTTPGQKWIGTAPACDAHSSDCKADLGMKYVLSATCGDGACCTTGKKVLCEPVKATPGQKWIGTAPVCGANPSDCKTELGMKYVLSAICGDGACCTSGQKVLCAPSNKYVPQTWIGTAPACRANSGDCAIFGMDYIQSNNKGDGARCFTGTKVLCGIPKKSTPPILPDANNQFNVLSYNIFDRPFVVSHDGQVERTCRIPSQIFSQIADGDNVDAIVIEEAFTSGCQSGADLRILLSFYGWSYSTDTVGGDSSKLSNGGVFIASKWPIQISKQEVFSACTGSDCLAAKGVMYARINKKVAGQSTTVNYNVFGTHLNAWAGKSNAAARLAQAQQILKFIHGQNIPSSEAVIIAGDLNMDNIGSVSSKAEVVQVLAAMNAKLPTITGTQKATTNPKNNPLDLEPGSEPQWLDYVLYSSEYKKPTQSSLQAIALQTPNKFKICMSAPVQPNYVYPDSEWCDKTISLKDLSDHYPVLGRFTY